MVLADLYLSLAFAPDGGPSIAYRFGVGTSTLKFAHKTGSGWAIQSIGTGQSYGVFASLAYDPLSGNPTIAHSNGSEVRFENAGTDRSGSRKRCDWDL